MDKHDWKAWGKRFKALAKENHQTLGTVAEKMDLAESTLRSWTNGTREVNLSDFFELCRVAGVNPSQVLFGGVPMDEELRRQVGALAKSVLDADPSVLPGYRKLTNHLKVKNKA